MGAEVVLFLIVAVVAIAAAALMLGSANAVHSALFLIVNFVCVAFMYLLLEAPFLAMVQIAVYAGAIMVLFLFVIMLLGAEKLPSGEKTRELRWLGPLGLALALTFLIAAAWGLSQGQIDSLTPPPGQAFVRFVNVAPESAQQPAADASPVLIDVAERDFDVYVNGQLVAESVTPSETSAFIALDAGEVTVTFSPKGTQVPLVTNTLNIAPDTIVTVVLYGEADSELTFSAITTDFTPTTRNAGRVIVFNAYPGTDAVSVVNVESELFNDSRKVNSVIGDLPYGSASTPLEYSVGATNWIVIEAGRDAEVLAGDTRFNLVRLSEDVSIASETEHLLVVSAERAFDGGDNPLRASLMDVPIEALDSYGSPQAMGRELFTAYILPLQLVAVLLLAAMIGVIVLTVKEEHTPKPSRAMRRKVSRPLTSVIASQTGSDLTAPAPLLEAPQKELPEETQQPVS